MKKKRLIVLSIITICLVTVLYLLYYFNYIPHKKYNNEYFNIKTYISDIDKDNDGIDDQTDILNNVRNYISKNPKYKSKTVIEIIIIPIIINTNLFLFIIYSYHLLLSL